MFKLDWRLFADLGFDLFLGLFVLALFGPTPVTAYCGVAIAVHAIYQTRWRLRRRPLLAATAATRTAMSRLTPGVIYCADGETPVVLTRRLHTGPARQSVVRIDAKEFLATRARLDRGESASFGAVHFEDHRFVGQLLRVHHWGYAVVEDGEPVLRTVSGPWRLWPAIRGKHFPGVAELEQLRAQLNRAAPTAL